MMNVLRWIKQNFFLSVLAFSALVAVFFAFVVLWNYTTFSIFDTTTGIVGDTFGVMNPFIAIAAAIITFAAFWVQYQANQEMIKSNRKQQIISRFYEMLAIHRDNVNEFMWNQNIYKTKDSALNIQEIPEEELVKKNGRQIFYYHLVEFNLVYEILKILSPRLKEKEKIQRAYGIFYFGKDDKLLTIDLRNEIIHTLAEPNEAYFSSKIKKIFEKYTSNIGCQELDEVIQILYQYRKFFLSQPPFFGRFEELNNYYRHLFLTVKIVANEDERYLSHNEKRALLRILRAQLSNKEQIMLFYNWFSGYGKKWEEETADGNHFFTKYRMIHNIIPHLMTPFRVKNDYYKAYRKFMFFFSSCTSIKRFGTNSDPIFEFEEWDDCLRFKYDA